MNRGKSLLQTRAILAGAVLSMSLPARAAENAGYDALVKEEAKQMTSSNVPTITYVSDPTPSDCLPRIDADRAARHHVRALEMLGYTVTRAAG